MIIHRESLRKIEHSSELKHLINLSIWKKFISDR